MIKINKSIGLALIISYLLYYPGNIFCQINRNNARTNGRNNQANATANTQNKPNQSGQSSQPSNTSNTSNGNGNTQQSGNGGNQSPGSQSNNIKAYDPYLDNHLKAPPAGINVGKFGRTIKQVEEELRSMGAKNHSYAFGKYSKMILSSYLITLSFDVNKRLGMVEVTPKYPLKTVESKAQEFFIKLFTEGADMSQVGITLSSNKLVLKFISPD